MINQNNQEFYTNLDKPSTQREKPSAATALDTKFRIIASLQEGYLFLLPHTPLMHKKSLLYRNNRTCQAYNLYSCGWILLPPFMLLGFNSS